MAIKRGQAWEHAVVSPCSTYAAKSDRQLGRHVQSLLGRSVVVSTLSGGDLARTLGVKAGGYVDLVTGERQAVAVDVLQVTFNRRRSMIATAHVQVGWLPWRRSIVANATWLGSLMVGPKGHPGDGSADRLDIACSATSWSAVRRRMKLGEHLPHPDLTAKRGATHRIERRLPCPVRVDGRLIGFGRTIDIGVVSDALTVVL